MSYETIAVRLPNVGSKRVCVSCATRFYDLARTPPVCPKCGTEQPPEAPRAAPVRRAPATRHRMMKSPAPAREGDDEAAPVLDADEDEAEDDADEEDAEVAPDEDEEDAEERPLDESHEP